MKGNKQEKKRKEKKRKKEKEDRINNELQLVTQDISD